MQFKRDFWICLWLFVIVFAVYSPVRTHDFINYDDPVYIIGNSQVRAGLTWDGAVWAFTSFEHSNWFPLTWLSHMFDCEMFGLDSGWHHLSNVFLHALSTAALFALMLRMTGSRWSSAFVALAFGIHPLHVESVAWAAERKDALSALFWILTLLAYVWYVENSSWRRYLAVAGLFTCGLMSKPMVVTLPFLMLLLDVWPLRRKTGARLLVEKIPLFALSAAGSAIAYIAQRQSGAVAGLHAIALPLRFENAMVTYILYIVKFIWPARLAVFYPYPERIEPWQWIGSGLALAAITALVFIARKTRPHLMVGWLWYVGTLVPVIGLVQVGSQARADRYTYLPLIGISIMLAWGIAELVKSPRALKAGAAILGCVWCAMTWSYLAEWKNSETLFRHAIQVTDRNWIAYNNLGGALRQQGQLPEAIVNFENAVRINPDFPDIQDNLGEALLNAGRLNQAVVHLTEALRLQPGFAKAHVDLGAALLRQNRPDQAASHFQAALALDPANAEAHFRWGGFLASQGRMQEAMPHFQAALPYLVGNVRASPNDAEAHHNLGGVLGLMGRMDEAIAEFSQTVRLRPGDAEAHYNLALALADRQHLPQAVAEFGQAVRLNPGYVMAHFNLARTLAAMGRNAEAEREFSETLRLAPNFTAARQGLASLRP